MEEVKKVSIDGSAVFQSALASKLGLPEYEYIIKTYKNTIVTDNPEFQRRYNHFYVVRRNRSWLDSYYQLFENYKGKEITFEKILSDISLFSDNRSVEASYASKMLATLNPNMPIWDSKVLKSLGLNLQGETFSSRFDNAIDLYSQIVTWYQKYINTEEAKNNIKIFNSYLPRYKWISDTKKIDYMLWSME